MREYCIHCCKKSWGSFREDNYFKGCKEDPRNWGNNVEEGGSRMQYNIPEVFVKKLQTLPETGMGYQIVDVKLKDGRLLSKVILLNSSILVIDEFLKMDEIEDMIISKEF